METVYLVCAVVGGTLIVIQFLLTLLGMGGGHDTDGGHDFAGHDAGGHDIAGHGAGGHEAVMGHDDAAGTHHEAAGHASTNWIFGVLTFRTIVAGLAFFGLTGMALQGVETNDTLRFLFSAGAGLVAIFIVSWIMRSLSRLNADGTLRIQKAVGAMGTVYLSIPGAKGGAGKVHVSVLGRLMEYRAITAHAGLPTGTKVIVVNVLGSDTVEVRPAESLETAPPS